MDSLVVQNIAARTRAQRNAGLAEDEEEEEAPEVATRRPARGRGRGGKRNKDPDPGPDPVNWGGDLEGGVPGGTANAAALVEVAAESDAVPPMEFEASDQQEAMRVLEQDAVRLGVRKRNEQTALLTRYAAAEGDEKRAIWNERLNAVRAVQRQQFFTSFSQIGHARISNDMFTLPDRLRRSPPARTANEYQEQDYRARLIKAVMRLHGLTRWPGTPPGGAEPKLCAYHALVVAGGGPDQLTRFLSRTAAVREAQQRLFDGGDLCGQIDTGLLGISHTDAAKFFTFYGTFKHHASVFFPDDGTTGTNEIDPLTLMRTVGSRRIGAEAPPKPAWGWGDAASRVVCGRMIRFLEELAFERSVAEGQRPIERLQAVPEINAFLRRVNEDTTGTPGPLSGDVFMEEYDGELASELIYMLWRIFNPNDVGRGTPANGRATAAVPTRQPGSPMPISFGATRRRTPRIRPHSVTQRGTSLSTWAWNQSKSNVRTSNALSTT